MKATISPAVLTGTIRAPYSKSYAHRCLIAEFLSGAPLSDYGNADDVLRTKEGLLALSFSDEINCGDSAATLRFLLPVAAALGKKVRFLRSEGLSKRPVEELISVLNEHGARIENDRVFGRIEAGRYEMTASVSSQFISGLLFALPLLEEKSELRLIGKRVSEPYIQMTVEILRAFGVLLEENADGFTIYPSAYRSRKERAYHGDYSGAAFYLVAGAIGGAVTVTGLCDDGQGDRRMIDCLRAFGASVSVEKDAVSVSKSALTSTKISCEDIPDLVPALAVLAAYAKGETRLVGISRLHYKESDRVAGILRFLHASGIAACVEKDSLVIVGGTPTGARFIGENDHRMVMAEAVLASFAKGDSEIEGAEAVKKSYPAFFEHFVSLGGKANVRLEGE